MVTIEEIQAIYYTVASLGVIGTLLTAIVGVRTYMNSNKRAEEAKKKEQETRDRELLARETQILMQLYNEMNAEFNADTWKFIDADFKTAEELMAKIQKNKEFGKAVYNLGAYYEKLGVLVKLGLLDIKYVAYTLAGSTKKYWEKYAPIIEDVRRITGYRRNMSETEYLYNELMKYMELHPELMT